jgi:PAS domain S-box-containing protein
MEASYEQMKQFEVTGRIGPYEKEYFRKDGSRWWFVFAGASLGDGTIVEFCIDVSARKKAEQALRESEERFRTMAAVLELAPVLVRDMESRIVLWTQGAERLYGFSKEEALGRISRDLFQTEFPEGKSHVDEGLRSVGKWEGELVHRKRDGEQLVVASQQIVYFDSSGRPARILEVDADITEQKKAEAALSQSAEQLRAFAAGLQQAREDEATRIAREQHDQLGRGLTAIKMDVDGIQRELSRNGVLERSAQPLLARAERTSQTVSEMVHTVHRISTELRPTILDDLGLTAAIEWQAKDFEARTGVACVVRLPEKDPLLSREQATALFRIFLESLTNVARHARATKVWVYLGEEDSTVVFEVEDNGVGISLAQLANCRSLGLLGMRERAAALGGKVVLTGAPGQGTNVVVRIPVLGERNSENPNS